MSNKIIWYCYVHAVAVIASDEPVCEVDNCKMSETGWYETLEKAG